MKFCCSTLLFLGRLLISSIFLMAGIGKLLDFEGTSQYMLSKGLAYVPLLLILASFLEIVCSIALIIGLKTRWAAFLLFLFLIPTTYIFHDFWNFTQHEGMIQTVMFMKNVAIMGGLLYIIGAGPGSFAADRCCRQSECAIEEA